ncbi:MAG: hypothetical protein E2581_19375 [Pseudomonas sp.]|uniref:hypothetical protein n=1 Tax=Pseudomonas TaxID=286 RepID=UPI0018A8F407|nr:MULTISPECIES: hypothetical protein [Pseudomonas]MBF8744995.1 hypothetical protein [Pseudomonas monteilii]MPT00637.1 hypothetical protein [Pseudomonas sp.]
MTAPASSSTSRSPFGKYLIRAAGRAGRLVNQLEASVMQSSTLASVPFGYRRLGMQTVKLVLLLAVASVAFFLAVGMLAVWAFAALPIEANDDEPDVFEVSHPQHRFKYPEMYDEHGSLR